MDPFITYEARVMARWVRRYRLPEAEFVRRHGAAFRNRHNPTGARLPRRYRAAA